jgi:hypothetical protein
VEPKRKVVLCYLINHLGKIMFVNFEVGALEKQIKLKGTKGPHVSHHDVFRPRAPAVATRPPPPPVLTAPPCTTPPHAPTYATLILSALSAKPHLPSSSSRDSTPHRSTSLGRHRAPPLSILTLPLLLFFTVPLSPMGHLKHRRAIVLVCQDDPQEVTKAELTPSAPAVRALHR